MSFEVGADDYAQFMGAYSEPLAVEFIDLVGVASGHRVLDVGCGPGALTASLVARLGLTAVAAVDPSESFVDAITARLPGVDVRRAPAEQMPFADSTFDAALAQLVVHFMSDPVAGIAEMARVTRPDGIVAASVWDQGGGRGPLSMFWRAVRELAPDAPDESERAGARKGQLAELFDRAGLRAVTSTELTVRREFASFIEWWEPMTLGVGPAGEYVVGLDRSAREALRARCADRVPAAPFSVLATAWVALGRV